jgi:hypothetical protein
LTSSFCQKGGLKGHVTDRTDNSGFAGITVSVLNNNDSTVFGTTTNQTGDFEIGDITPGTYRLKLQFLDSEKVIYKTR